MHDVHTTDKLVPYKVAPDTDPLIMQMKRKKKKIFFSPLQSILLLLLSTPRFGPPTPAGTSSKSFNPLDCNKPNHLKTWGARSFQY